MIALQNLQAIPFFFTTIFTSAFSVNSIAEGGVLLMVFFATYLSVISSEAGFGTSTIASGMATTTHPATMGLVNMITVFIDNLVFTLTGFVFMLALEEGIVFTNFSSTSEIIMHYSGTYYYGGAVLLLAIIFVFSLGSIITSATYGLQVIKYLIAKHRVKLVSRIYYGTIILIILLTPFGYVDDRIVRFIFAASGLILFSINIIAVILLRDVAFKTFKHYKRTSKVFKPDELKIKYQDENNIWK